MTRAWLRSALLLFLFALSMARGLAQDKPETPLFLVARPDLQDPFFKESVVLMLPLYDTEPRIVIGLIVNKPTHISLSKVFPKEQSLRNRSDTVYFGGPVDTESQGAVFRAAKPAKQAFHLFDDLYITFDSDFIVDMLKKTKNDGSVRIFLGRAQWAPEQLEGEMLLRAWDSEHAESSLILSTAPKTLWHILFQRAEPGPVAELRLSPFAMLEKFDLAKPLFGLFQGPIRSAQVTPFAGEDLIPVSHFDDHGAPPFEPFSRL